MVGKTSAAPTKWVVPGRRAPGPSSPKKGPPPPRVRAAAAVCAVALVLSGLVLFLARAPEEPAPAPPSAPLPAAPAADGQTLIYETENVRLIFKAQKPEEAAPEADPAEESP